MGYHKLVHTRFRFNIGEHSRIYWVSNWTGQTLNKIGRMRLGDPVPIDPRA